MKALCLMLMLAWGAPLAAEPSYRSIPLTNHDFSQSWSGGEQYGWPLFNYPGSGSQGVYEVSTVWEGDGYVNRLRLATGNVDSRVGVAQEVLLNQTEPLPVYVESLVKVACVSIKEGSYFGACLYVERENMDGTWQFYNTPADWGCGEWQVVGLNLNRPFPAFLPEPDPKPIRRIFVIPFLADAQGEAFFDNISVREYTGRPAPAVTVMFDDAVLSTYETALPILQSYGVPSSLAVPAHDLGREDNFTTEQLRSWARSGNTVLSHGYLNELGARQGVGGADMGFNIYSPAQARAPLRGSREELQEILSSAGIGHEVKHFAYPYGAYRTPLNRAAQDYYASARLAEQVSNPVGCFRWTVGVRSMRVDTPMSDVGWWLDETVRRNHWTILLFHGIQDGDSDVFYNTPAQFRAVLDLVRGKGIRFLTYDQGINEFAATPFGGEYGEHSSPE